MKTNIYLLLLSALLYSCNQDDLSTEANTKTDTILSTRVDTLIQTKIKVDTLIQTKTDTIIKAADTIIDTIYKVSPYVYKAPPEIKLSFFKVAGYGTRSNYKFTHRYSEPVSVYWDFPTLNSFSTSKTFYKTLTNPIYPASQDIPFNFYVCSGKSSAFTYKSNGASEECSVKDGVVTLPYQEIRPHISLEYRKIEETSSKVVYDFRDTSKNATNWYWKYSYSYSRTSSVRLNLYKRSYSYKVPIYLIACNNVTDNRIDADADVSYYNRCTKSSTYYITVSAY